MRRELRRYVPPSRMRGLRWIGHGTYRVLSYYLSVRWNWASAGTYVERILTDFAVPPDPAEEADPPTPGFPASYSLIDRGPESGKRYRLHLGDYEMVASRDPRDPLSFLSWHIHEEAMRRTGDFFLVHAGAVVSPSGQGVVFPAVSGAGKTSLVAALVRRGFGYLSDEAAVIDPVTRLIHPYPRALAVKAGMFDRFIDVREAQGQVLSATTTWYIRPDELRPGSIAGPCRVGLVVFPEHRAGGPTTVTEISAAEATVEIARHTMNLSLYRARGILLLADVTRAARRFRLRSGSLEDAVSCVESLASRGPDRVYRANGSTRPSPQPSPRPVRAGPLR